jgi:hypothetical protein
VAAHVVRAKTHIFPGAVRPDLDARLLGDWRDGDLW